MPIEYTDELQKVIENIQNTLVKEYPTDVITPTYIIIGMLTDEECVAYKSLSRVVFTKNIETLVFEYRKLLSQISTGEKTETPKWFDGWGDVLAAATEVMTKFGHTRLNSGHIIIGLMSNDEKVMKVFKEMNVSIRQLSRCVESEDMPTALVSINKDLKNKVSSNNKTQPSSTAAVRQTKQQLGEAEKNLTNLNNQAAIGIIDEYYTNDNELYFNLFSSFAKKRINNVIVTGKHGVGKTAFVKHIANLLNTNNVPEPFKDKILLQVNLSSLMVGAIYRGSFEAKMRPIIEDAKNRGSYIFFIDNIHEVFDDKKHNDSDVASVIETLLDERNIPVICTASDLGYSNLQSDEPTIARKFERFEIEEPDELTTCEILRTNLHQFETFHNVKFLPDVVEICARMCKQYITDACLPGSAIDIIDTVGARLCVANSTNSTIVELTEKLQTVKNKLLFMRNAASIDYNDLDVTVKEEIRLKTALANERKKINLSAPPTIATVDDVRGVISRRTKIPLQKITLNEKEKLKNIAQTLKECVIGQDAAIDEVCKVVKRQRVGLSNPNKPSVFLFVASSGVGKTYLAKKLAEKVFGDEKYLVRLDMSEYADKTGTNKLIGAGSGYIGYDKGGILTEAIKNKKYCVLLLDEIEKAHDEVHNMFLQMFDDGRMTDNHGVVVDFKNIIVIMTSNVGAAEAQMRGSGVGFVTDKESLTKSIMSNELKKKFKPEFINRIDNIIHFNPLTSDDLRRIVRLEISKVKSRVEKLGYGLDSTITEGVIADEIHKAALEQSEFGARPIIREVQRRIEDVIADMVIENCVEDGHVFTADELGCHIYSKKDK